MTGKDRAKFTFADIHTFSPRFITLSVNNVQSLLRFPCEISFEYEKYFPIFQQFQEMNKIIFV
jgi:hypothetical protein